MKKLINALKVFWCVLWSDRNYSVKEGSVSINDITFNEAVNSSVTNEEKYKNIFNEYNRVVDRNTRYSNMITAQETKIKDISESIDRYKTEIDNLNRSIAEYKDLLAIKSESLPLISLDSNKPPLEYGTKGGVKPTPKVRKKSN